MHMINVVVKSESVILGEPAAIYVYEDGKPVAKVVAEVQDEAWV